MSRSSRMAKFGAYFLILIVAGLSAKQQEEGALELALRVPDDLSAVPLLKQRVDACVEAIRKGEASRSEMMVLAQLYHANGYSNRGIALYDWLISGSEDNQERGRLNYLAANLVREKGDSASALTYLENSVSAYAGYPHSLVALGDAKFKLGRLEEAEVLYGRAIELEGDLANARIGIARVHERRGELEQMVTELESLLVTQPGNGAAQALLSQIYARQGDGRKAYDMSESIAYSIIPQPVDPWLLQLRESIMDAQRLDFLFLDYFMVGQVEAALPYLERMEALDPENVRCFQYRGVLSMQAGDYGNAEMCFRNGLDGGGESHILAPLLVKALSFQGRKRDAELAARDALERYGASSEVCLELARLLIERRNLREADVVLSKGVERDPYDIEVLLVHARVSLWLRDLDTARDRLNTVRQLSPMDSKVLVRAGLIFMEAGRFDDALPFLEQANAASPYFGEAQELLADVYFEQGREAAAGGNIAAALDLFDRSLEKFPTHRDAMALKAKTAFDGGFFELAESTMKELLIVVGDEPGMLLVYGDLLFRNGKRGEALEKWEKALEILGSSEIQNGEALKRQLEERLRRQ